MTKQEIIKELDRIIEAVKKWPSKDKYKLGVINGLNMSKTPFENKPVVLLKLEDI